MRGLCALLLIVSVAACGGKGAEPLAATPTTPTGTLSASAAAKFSASGRVVAHQNQAPIPGATVSIKNGPDAGASTTTDTEGRFAFKDLHESSGLVLVNASAAGYFDNYAPLTLNQTITVFLVETGPNIVLTGQVIDAVTSSPIAGATVRINGRYQTTADSSGNYSLTGFLDIGDSSFVEASADGYDFHDRYIHGVSRQSFRLHRTERITAGDSWTVIVKPDDSLCYNNLQDPSLSVPSAVFLCRTVRVVAPSGGVMNLEAVSTADGAHPALEVEVIGVTPCCSERIANPTSVQVPAGIELKVSLEIPESSTASQTFRLTTSMTGQ